MISTLGKFKPLLFAASFGTVLLAAGCGVNSSDSSSRSPDELQVVSGTVLDASGAPSGSLQLQLLSTGEYCVTAASGSCEIESSGLLGDIDIEVLAPWGPAVVVIESIPSRARRVDFIVTLDPLSRSATVSDIELTYGAAPSDPSTPNGAGVINEKRCSVCHELQTAALCGDPAWEVLHDGVFRCPNIDELPEEEDPFEPGAPGATPRPSATPGKKPTPRPGLCTTCHEDRGSPRCNSSSWRAIHRFYNCGGGGGGGKNPKNPKKSLKDADSAFAVIKLLTELE